MSYTIGGIILYTVNMTFCITFNFVYALPLTNAIPVLNHAIYNVYHRLVYFIRGIYVVTSNETIIIIVKFIVE